MKVFIVTEEPFPVGMAATNRMISLARGLVETGVPVHVICIRTTEDPRGRVANTEAKGTFQGISYEYACGTTLRGRSFPERRWLGLKGLVRPAGMLSSAPGRNKGDALMVYLSKPPHLLMYYLTARLLGMSYVQDKSEYPFVLHRTSFLGRLYAGIYTACAYRFFDGIIVMTKPLEGYFRERMRKGGKILHVPMTVESARFTSGPGKSPDAQPFIAYCGYLGGNKDGVPILIRAFAELASKHKDVRLYIIGDSPGSRDMEELERLAAGLGLAERVVFTGRVTRDEMPRYLCNARVLALARPTSLQSQGGFPTKLGEYLSTGNPVVVTRVGDIPSYLTDGENAFMSEPDDPHLFALKLDEALSDPSRAKEIGLRGRQVALTHFDYRVQAQALKSFLTTLGGKAV